jgi:ankyrin repeat protein
VLRRLLPFCGISIFLASISSAANVNDDFYRVIRANDLAHLRSMIASADVNSKDSHGETPLMYAAAVGSVDAMKVLLSKKADVNAQTEFGATALMWSVSDSAKVRLLVSSGANVNAATKRGRTALFLAAMNDHSADIVSFLLLKGADAKALDAYGNSTLVAAALGNDLETIRMIVAAGVDAGAGNKAGFAPIHAAAGYRANIAATRLLLSKGANVNAVAMAPSHFLELPAPKAGQPMLSQLTALTMIAPYGPVELVKILLDAGADVNARDARGMTPLMLAVGTDRQDPAVIRMLLEHHADPSLKSSDGETAADWARKIGLPHGLDLLKASAAKPQTMAVAETAPDTRTAVQRSIALMEKTSKGFFEGSGCVSCHAQSITDLAVGEARSKGLQINEQALKDRAQMVRIAYPVEPTYEALDILDFAPEIGGYAGTGLAATGYPADRMTDAMTVMLAAKQAANGSWHSGGFARPPTEESDISRTALVVRVLKAYGPPGRSAEMQSRIAAAQRWLRAAKPFTADDRNMQLLGLFWSGADGRELAPLAKAVLAGQQPDGGWAQREGLSSDAYATGQSLYALSVAGVRSSDPAFKNGVRFLLKTQAPDGSWHVVSRAPKFQIHFESGFPYGGDQWISQWATGWAAMALAQAIEAPVNRAAR